MPTLSELQDYRRLLKDQWQDARNALLGIVHRAAPDAATGNRAYDALELLDAAFEEEMVAPLDVAISEAEDDAPGEDPRREHGTYFTANGMRAA